MSLPEWCEGLTGLEGWWPIADMMCTRPYDKDGLMIDVYQSECESYGNEWFLHLQHPNCEPTTIVMPNPQAAIDAANFLMEKMKG